MNSLTAIRILALAALLALSLSACAPGAPEAALPPTAPEAITVYGAVRGKLDDGVSVFLGIPYGADTSSHRFQRATTPTPWNGVRETLTYPDTSPQVELGGELFASWDPVPRPPQSENMLGLNVWTPAVDAGRRPVMVWLHGGGFTAGYGSSRVFEGTRLAQKGNVVVVTVNHRLNLLGYLYLADLPGGEAFPDSGNAGMLDLVLALEWVRDNIAAFGGDPENVTIFGESGGGWKVSTLLAMPEAEGLIDRAIVQSGSARYARTPDEATSDARIALTALGVSPDDLESLKTLPAEKFAETMKVLEADGTLPANFFMPVADGRALPADPFGEAAPATARSVPMLIGSTADEFSLFFLGIPDTDAITFETLPGFLRTVVPEADQLRVIAGYRALRPDASPYEILVAIASDRAFTADAVAQAELKVAQGGAPVWLYQFDWKTPVLDGRLGAMHALETGFVFDNLEKSTSMIGDITPAQPVADRMSDAWLAFARTGDPNVASLPAWPAVTADTVSAMHFNTASEVETGYFSSEADILQGLPNMWQMGR